MEKTLPAPLLCCLILLLLCGTVAVSAAADIVTAVPTTELHPAMHMNRTTMQQWNDDYYAAAPVQINQTARTRALQSTGSRSVLASLPYTPTERDQGHVNNCWVWSSTGVLEVAHTRQSSVKNRLSVQYFDSNFNGGSGPNWAGDHGGTFKSFVDFYNGLRMVVPWSNTNANYQDGRVWCLENQRAWVPAGSIQTNPHYDLSSISLGRIDTEWTSQRMAIANIKSVIDRGQAVDMAFWLPDGAAWTDFNNFWRNNGETAVWNPSKYSGLATTGHCVVCVGYDDTDPNNRYWILLNSWGTANGRRPHGTFRMKMDLDYGKTYGTPWGESALNTQWMTIDVTFKDEPLIADFSLSPAAGAAPLLVGYGDTSTGAPTSWSWNFGNGKTSTEQDPFMNIYQYEGAYPVTLTIRDAAGRTSTKTRTIMVSGPSSLGDAVDAPMLPWPKELADFTPWSVDRTISHDGQDSARSADLWGNWASSSRLSTTVTGPATVSFWWKVSSETNYDFLRFSIDGIESSRISGEKGWTQKQVSIGSGTHTLAWVYEKDGAYADGSNAGWLDQVTVTYPVRPISPSVLAPRDLNNDGRYDDVNGNGRKDFADVVLYFNQMTWIAANEPLSAFDYNGNGRIDFADVTWLFNNL